MNHSLCDIASKNEESCSNNTLKSRKLFNCLELSKLNNEILQKSGVNNYSLENSMKESYTARATNSKVLGNYHPMFAVNKEARNLAKNGSFKRLGNSQTYLQYDENIPPSAINALQPSSSLNTKAVVDRLNDKLKKMSSKQRKIKRTSNLTKISDLSTSSVNNQSKPTPS